MGLVHVGWGTDSHGARNVAGGEYDTAFWFTVTLGLPVYSSCRGCWHVIRTAEVRPRERLAAIRSFVQEYLGWSEAQARHLPAEVHLPLRQSATLRWMGTLESAVWLLGALGALGLLATLAISNQPDPFRRQNLLFLAPFWLALAAFVLGLGFYLLLRRPSRRQCRIRGVVAGLLGPFSDVAGWRSDLAARVGSTLGVSDTDPEVLAEEAECWLANGNPEEAVLLARAALALVDGSKDAVAARRAEALTDDCLQQLERR
jgi:hypothetical protein